jgi:hypothetical protein
MNGNHNRVVVHGLAAIALLGSATAFAAGAPHVADPYGVAAGGEFHQNRTPSRVEYIQLCTREADQKHLSASARASFLKQCERNA